MFQDQIIWITGASSGIGEALAHSFARRGAKLILSARREAELARVRDAVVGAGASADAVWVLPLDVTDAAAVAAAVDTALGFAGHVDLLFNNAGISQRALAVDTDMATYRTLFEVDFFGQVALTKALLPHMIARGSGHFAITASVAGKVGVPYRTGYCAVKHAVMGFFDALRAEVSQHGIQVTTVTPGFIKTAIAEHALKGDGTAYGEKDQAIEHGMAADACAEHIVRKMEQGVPEIPVGGRREMVALLIKRLFPKRVFKMVETLGKPKPVKN